MGRRSSGGGGSNYTGGYTGSASVTLNTNTPMLAASLTSNSSSSKANPTFLSSSSPIGSGPTLQTGSVVPNLAPTMNNSTDSDSSSTAGRSAFQAELSFVSALSQSIDALALQRLELLLSMEAGAMGVTRDTLMRDLFFVSLSAPNGV